jgi:hypothetical protein
MPDRGIQQITASPYSFVSCLSASNDVSFLNLLTGASFLFTKIYYQTRNSHYLVLDPEPDMRGPELAAVATPRTIVSSVIRAFTGTLSSGSNRNPRPDVETDVPMEESSENDPDLQDSLPEFPYFVLHRVGRAVRLSWES